MCWLITDAGVLPEVEGIIVALQTFCGIPFKAHACRLVLCANKSWRVVLCRPDMWQENCGTSKLSVAVKQLRKRTHTTILRLYVLLKLYKKRGQNHAPATLPSEKNSTIPTEYETGWVSVSGWTFWRRDAPPASAEIGILYRPACSWAAIPTSGVPRGGGGLGVQPPPPKFRRPFKIVPNKTRLWKLLKIAEFRTPTPQDVRKKAVKF